MTYTICPPAPQDIHYDAHQFKSHGTHAVKATLRGDGTWDTPGISFSDYQRMSGMKKCTHRYRGEVPVWAADGKILREVILRYLLNRYYQPHHTDKSYEERLAIVRKASAYYLPSYRHQLDKLIDYNKKGLTRDTEVQILDSKIMLEQRGIPELVASLVYMYYKLGYSSTQIANEIGIKPPHVRIILYRLRIVWKDMQAGKKSRHDASAAVLAAADSAETQASQA